MAITKRPKVQEKTETKSIDDFISSAPDASIVSIKKGVMRGKKEQISHTISPALLAFADEMAETKGLSRAGLINLAISEYIEKNKV